MGSQIKAAAVRVFSHCFGFIKDNSREFAVSVISGVAVLVIWQLFSPTTDPGVAVENVAVAVRESAKSVNAELRSLRDERDDHEVWVVERDLSKNILVQNLSCIQDERECNSYMALQKYKEGDFERAYAYAKNGDLSNSDVQFIVGGMKYFGLGTEKDEKEAFHMWQKAATQGNPNAQYDLGIMYARGEFVATNVVLAMQWLRTASSNGNARASFVIGDAFENGRFGYKDHALSVKWYVKAFDQGLVHAGYHLARLYDRKTSIVRDKAKSVKWYEKAANAGDLSAMHHLGFMLLRRDPQRGVSMLERAFENGAIDAGCSLYFAYRLGVNLVVDDKKAEYWLEKIAERSPETARSIREPLPDPDDDCDEYTDKLVK